MIWFTHLFRPRGRLAGAMLLATTLALAASLFAAPASAQENRRVREIRGNLEGGRGALIARTSYGGRVLRDLRFEHDGQSIVLHRGPLVGTRLGGLGFRFALPSRTWELVNPYLGRPYGYPTDQRLGPMVITTGVHQPALLRGFNGVIGLGQGAWLRFSGD